MNAFEFALHLFFLPVFIPAKIISVLFFMAHSNEMPTFGEWLGLDELAV